MDRGFTLLARLNTITTKMWTLKEDVDGFWRGRLTGHSDPPGYGPDFKHVITFLIQCPSVFALVIPSRYRSGLLEPMELSCNQLVLVYFVSSLLTAEIRMSL